MKNSVFFFLIGCISGAYITHKISQPTTHVTRAIATIHPTKGNKVTGTVTFQTGINGTHVHAQLQNLSPGKHGFHIHELGDCSCADALCTKDHFNPTNQPHGGPENEKRHVGDLGNIIADEQGNATLDLTSDLIKLSGPQNIIGRSLIVHANEDDLISQPTGNAGKRIGCGVIGIEQEKSD